MKDIQDRKDIEKLIRVFYEKMLADQLLGSLFTDVDLDHHFPILFDFWESILFQAGNYKRNTMQPHLDLHFKYQLTDDHFKQWLFLFNETVDEFFIGEKATQAKERARTIAMVIQAKIKDIDKRRLEINN